MTIPNLPTDNLYKFIALTGVVLFVISIFYIITKEQELATELIILNGEIEAHSYERKTLDDRSQMITIKIQEFEEKCKCGTHAMSDSLVIFKFVNKPEAIEIVNEIAQLINQKNEFIKEISLKAIAINTKHSLIEIKRENLNHLINAVAFYIPISLFLSVAGFILWYIRTQRYTDKILKFNYIESFKYDHCQSCGVNFINDERFKKYTNEESENIKFCTECFRDGQFIEDKLTLSDMESKVKSRCQELHLGKIATYLYISRLRNLERWLPRFRWK